MAIDSKVVALINAEIDGELGRRDRGQLEALLAEDAEARAFRDELKAVCRNLDSLEDLEPPAYLRHQILEAARPKPARKPSGGAWRDILMSPVLRYAGAFAAGMVLTLSFVSSDRISRSAFDDVEGLVGTISEPPRAGSASIHVSRNEVTGTVNARKAGPLVVVDFDLVSMVPVDIEAGFSDKNVWFNGFAQLESSGTSVSAEPGKVTLHMDGRRRYALFLNNSGGREMNIDLRFMAAGEVIHEAQLSLGGPE